MKLMKKALAVLLALLMLLPFGTVSFAAGEEPEIVASGDCGAQGDNLTWTLSTDGILTISGRGEMKNYSHIQPDLAPWYKSTIINTDYPDVVKVVVEENVTSIGDFAFYWLGQLSEVSLPSTVTHLGEKCFFCCESLETLELPAGLTKIDARAFCEARGLTHITIPEGVSVIEKSAFDFCTSLTSITLPDSLTTIGDYAFRGTALTTFHVSAGLETLGFRALPNRLVTAYTADENNPNYVADEAGCLYTKDMQTLIYYPIANTRTGFTVPAGVKTIAAYAFSCANHLETVNLPDTLETIEARAFSYCQSLPDIELPAVKTIGNKAFLSCIRLEEITLTPALTSISEGAFSGCEALTDVYYLGTAAQWNAMAVDTTSNDYFLRATVYFHQDGHHVFTEELVTEPTAENEGLKRYSCTLCPYSYTETLPACAHVWNSVYTVYPTETTPGEIVYTCALCGQENRVELPVALTVVERGDCGAEGSDVQYVLYSDGTMVISGDGAIKEKAFENREDITALWVMDGVTEIGKSAFEDCHSLQSISLADTVKTVDDFAFLDCNGVSAIDYGNGLESIGEDSFRSTPTKAPIILPNSLKTIGLQAFEYTEFNTVVFGTGLEYAASGALYCTCVTRVAFLNGNTVIGENNQGDLTWMNAGYGPTIYSYAGGTVEENAILTDRNFVDLTAIEETDHNWSDGTVTKLPTCTEPGVKTYVCLNNPTHTYTEEIPMAPHKWVLESNTEPTCDTAGSRVYSCALCDATHTETLPATGEHSYDGGVITVYPTETTDGEIRYTCTECGDTYTDTVPATPYQDWLYTESYPTGNGQIGEHVYYTTYYDGHVSIYGEGETYPTSHYVPYDYYYRPIGGNPTSIEVHEGVTGLMCKGMFCNYPQLEYVKLPASLTYIESMVFDTIQVLTAVDVAAANPSYTSQNGILFNKDMTELLLYPSGKTENSYTVPDGVEIIGEMAFHKNPVLKTVTLPDSVKEIGNTAFNSSVLETVNLGNGLETIERFAFSNCKNLESIRIPTSVKFIGRGVFQFDDNFKNVYYDCPQDAWNAIEFEPLVYENENDEILNATFTFGEHDWGDWTIAQNSTYDEPGLAQRVCKTNPDHTETFVIPAYGPAIEVGDCGQDGDPVYYIVYEDGTLLITGTGAIRAHMLNTGAGPISANVYNSNRLIIEDGVTAIGNSAFAFLHFNSIDFGNTLVSIGYDAFYDNDGFETVVLPDSVKTVGDCAFGLSSYLKTVVFGPNVETVGDWALGQCYNLENVVFLNKDTQIMEGEPQEHLGTVLHTVNSGTIYGYAGGAVETYARTYGFNFVAIDRIDWITLPYGDDGLQDGDWYLDLDAFVDAVGRGKTEREKDEVRDLIRQHVTFKYNPGDRYFVYRFEYTALPVEDGEPITGYTDLPIGLALEDENAFPYDYNALKDCVRQYRAPDKPDEPEQKQEEESWFQKHIVGPLKSAVSTILSFFRKLFKKKK